MGEELAVDVIVELQKIQKVELAKKLNNLPHDTFRRHSPGWSGELSEDEQRDNELYDVWLASLKPGDMVYYSQSHGYYRSHTFTTVNNVTKTGMLRLADDKLVEKSGRVKGERCCLQPFTEAYDLYNKRKHSLCKLSDMKFDHLTNEGLALVLRAIQQAEAMLLKLLEGGQQADG